MNVPEKLTSRKLWVTIITAVTVFLSSVTGVDMTDAQTAALVVISGVYVLAEAIVDFIGTLTAAWERGGTDAADAEAEALHLV